MEFDLRRQAEEDARLVCEIYAAHDEEIRLNRSKAARVEFLTNVKYIESFLKPGARILDVGAGAGEYSLYFAQRGCAVSAVELSPVNVEKFRARLRPGMRIDLRQGNALDLSEYADDSFDAVLMLGPLYHLHGEADRQRCISEAKRVCRPDGAMFFAFLSNDMVILTEFARRPDFFNDADYDRETFHLTDFPFVFHTVAEARRMLADGGVRILREVASDGMSELMAERINALDDDGYAQYLRYHFYACEKPEVLGHSNHLLLIGAK